MEIHAYIRTYVCMYDVCVYVCTRVGVHGGGGRELDDAAAVRACVCVCNVCAASPSLQRCPICREPVVDKICAFL